MLHWLRTFNFTILVALSFWLVLIATSYSNWETTRRCRHYLILFRGNDKAWRYTDQWRSTNHRQAPFPTWRCLRKNYSFEIHLNFIIICLNTAHFPNKCRIVTLFCSWSVKMSKTNLLIVTIFLFVCVLMTKCQHRQPFRKKCKQYSGSVNIIGLCLWREPFHIFKEWVFSTFLAVLKNYKNVEQFISVKISIEVIFE